MKRVISMVMALLMVMVVMSGCGAKQAEESKGNGESKNAELSGWEYVKNNGKLIIGLDDTFAPMGFRDEGGNLVGFDIDLANAVGEYLGIEIVFQPIDWNAKELELSSKRIDCIWNGMSATEERQKSMALTKKYLNNKIIVMTLDDSVKVESVKDLSKLKIGTQADSAALEAMEANSEYSSFSSNISEYGTYDEAILDMQAGRLDCIVVDQVLGEYKNKQMGESMNVCSFDFGDDFYAIGCRSDETDLADKLNEAIQSLINNGKAGQISSKWFGKDIVILEDYK